MGRRPKHPRDGYRWLAATATIVAVDVFDPNSATHRSQLERLRRHLLARIHRRYQTVTQSLRFGQIEFEFTRIVDPDVVLDQVAREADRRERTTGTSQADLDLHLPYWAELWDSASGIGHFLASSKLDVQSHLSLHVLDLGCGMGLSGTVAAALGAEVLFADLEPPALLFAKLNTLPWKHRVHTRRLNWQTDRLEERFDLILGADILYEKAQWPFLNAFWQNHLKDGGSVLLGEPGRQSGEVFLEWVRPLSWRVEIFEQAVETRRRPIRIVRLTQ